MAAGNVIAKLLVHEVSKQEGYPLESLNLSFNRLENTGVELLFQAIQSNKCYLQHLNITKVDMSFLNGVTTNLHSHFVSELRLKSFIIDDNQLRPKTLGRLATFVAMSKDLEHLSMRNCAIEDACFTLVCD